MGQKRILCVGLELAHAETEHVSLRSKTSLLDWDIILIQPDTSDFQSYGDYFQGKPSLDDRASFQLKDCCEHWRREIKQALDAGKTILVFLSELNEVYVDTGQRSYSGTGRNQKTTRHVAEYNNYMAIPAAIGAVSAKGNAMKLASRGAEVLAAYWAEFAEDSEYKVLLTHPGVPACIVTKAGDKAAGALYRSKSSAGTLLLLPDIDFLPEEFVKHQNGQTRWTPAANQFAARMVAAVVAMDKALRSAGEVTPEPPWASDPQFALGTEGPLRTQLLEAEREVESAQKRKEAIQDKLRSAGAFRALLYEKGTLLENAIIEALRVLGFTAGRFKESDSEFDVVFESVEGRLIGEAEGKDTKAVNVDKLRQLAMNIHEDLQREEVTTPAKPVLFGNGFRLVKVADREDPFTGKCLSAASTSSTALVFTPDLFKVIQSLVASPNPDYAKACRQAMLTTTGRVTFPSPPPTEAPEPIQTEKAE